MKSLLLFICIFISIGALAQGRGNQGAEALRKENLNALKLSKEQKAAIGALIKKEEALHEKNMKEVIRAHVCVCVCACVRGSICRVYVWFVG